MADASFKEVRLEPLSGGMDTRTPSGSMDFGTFRLCLNMDGSEWGTMCRMPGFRKYLGAEECYLNQDLHDQLIGGQTYFNEYQRFQAGWSVQSGYSWALWPPYTASYPMTGTNHISTAKLVRVTNNGANNASVLLLLNGVTQYTFPTTLTPGQTKDFLSYISPTDPTGLSWNQVGVKNLVTLAANAMFYTSTLPLQVTFNGATISSSALGEFDESFASTGFTSAPYQLPVYERIADYTYDYCGGIEYTLGRTCREAITLLHSFENEFKQRRLIAGTKTRLYVSDESGGNWRILADGLGGACQTVQDCLCSPTRFTAASIGDITLFGNGVDYVMFWQFEEGPSGCSHWSADFVQELLELDIDSAEIVQGWGGFAFMARVRTRGEYIPGRLFWSDYNEPLSWAPQTESLAGYHDFGAGEAIIAIEPIGGRLRIYTSQAIYDAVVSTSVERVFDIQEIYRGTNLPTYRFSMVKDGNNHWFLSEDTVFRMAEYDREPTQFLWIHLAAGVIYKGLPSAWVNGFTDKLPAFGPIVKSKCDLVSGGYDQTERAVWFSWPTEGSDCPNMSLVIWNAYNKSTLYDHGFTAFASHRPNLSPTLRDFLASTGLCDPSEQIVAKEGSPCDLTFVPGEFTGIWNETENPDLPMDPNSWLAPLCATCVEDICKDCDTDVRFVLASATDKTIKEFDTNIFYREIMTDPGVALFPASPVATYEQRGYTSLIAGDAFHFKTLSDKYARGLAANWTADDQTVPGDMRGEMGAGAQADCLTWELDEMSVPIGMCIDPASVDDGFVRQGMLPSYNFLARGSYLAWRVWTTGTGNQFCMTSITLRLQATGACW